MIRKTILSAFLIIAAAVAWAQQSTGQWRMFTSLSDNIDRITETPSKVYYVSGQRLFSYDKESGETYAYNVLNKLNDNSVALIRYNPDGKYLLVGYTTGNIDLLYDNGRVVNMSDIAAAPLTTTKGLLSVNFADNRIYIGTDFGFVIYDDKRHEVVESANFASPVYAVTPMGEFLLITRSLDSAIRLYCAPLKAPHNTLDKFTLITHMNARWLQPFGNSALYYDSNNKDIRRVTFDTSGEKIRILTNELASIPCTTQPDAWTDGFYTVTPTEIVFLDNDSQAQTRVAVPEAIAGNKISTWKGISSVWGADSKGVANYDLTGGNVTVLADKFKPEGIVTDEVVYQMFDNWGRLWTGNKCATRYVAGYQGNFLDKVQALSRIDPDGTPHDMNAHNVTYRDNNTKYYQRLNPQETRMFGACTSFIVDPVKPERYYQATVVEGIYVIEDGKEVAKWDQTNSPLIGAWGPSTWTLEFDPEGNLWVGINAGKTSVSSYYMLPKAKLYGDLSALTAADWQISAHLGTDPGDMDMGAMAARKSPVLFTWTSAFRSPLGITKTNGTWSNTADDRFFYLRTPQDQDGKVFEPDRICCVTEDQRGRVWVGTSSGVIEIQDPGALTETSRITRIKVPRNDGTNYADYLCESDLIYDIAVDPSNRKWLATQGSGVFLVSENGDRIIQNFTTSNSPLPSNEVLSVACDPNSNTVYFGLKNGLLAYSADASPAAEDYSNVYAYPNPVHPDYTGYITITNLMDNSLVKITDVNGNVVHQTRSEGGMATWDGTDAGHNPVKSGVYYVFASQSQETGSKGAVTKILIVR